MAYPTQFQGGMYGMPSTMGGGGYRYGGGGNAFMGAGFRGGMGGYGRPMNPFMQGGAMPNNRGFDRGNFAGVAGDYIAREQGGGGPYGQFRAAMGGMGMGWAPGGLDRGAGDIPKPYLQQAGNVMGRFMGQGPAGNMRPPQDVYGGAGGGVQPYGQDQANALGQLGPRMSQPYTQTEPQISAYNQPGQVGSVGASGAGTSGMFGPAPMANADQQMQVAQSMYGSQMDPHGYGIMGGGIGANGTPLTAVDTLNRPQLGTPQTRDASEAVMRQFISQFGREQGLAQYRNFLDNQAIPLSAVGGGGDTAPVNLNRRLY